MNTGESGTEVASDTTVGESLEACIDRYDCDLDVALTSAIGKVRERLKLCSATNKPVFDVVVGWSASELPPLSPECDDAPNLMNIANQLWGEVYLSPDEMGDTARVAFQVARAYFEACRSGNHDSMLSILLLSATSLALEDPLSESQ